MTEKCPFQFDLMNPMTYHERIPFEAFATLRSRCPVSYQSGAGEHATSFHPVPILHTRPRAATTPSPSN
jgi:hypothetical protein